MHDNRTHPLLQQVPLTVSPFVKLPTAVTLPYRYKSMPSTLPPSVTGIPSTTATVTDDSGNSSNPDGAHHHHHHHHPPSSTAAKPRYVVAPSGHAAHPDEILESCRALLSHVTQMCAKAEQDLAALDERIRARDLAEKRRVAPGWLDSDARLLEPEKKGPAPSSSATTTTTTTTFSSAAAAGTEATGGGKAPGEMLLQQPVARPGGEYGSGGGGAGVGYAGEQEPTGPCEMAVPDEGEQLDRAFGTLKIGGS